MKHDNDQFYFLSQQGEMGNLIREKDWSKTSLGPPDTWPQSLRTTLGIILNSKFPMFLFWGPELICFYNDAYRPSLGTDGKHPHALGNKAIDVWPEIWHIIKPIIDDVMRDGSAHWSEDQLIPINRNGRLEDVYWTFSYSPVYNETAEPYGVFITCSETTGRIYSETKLKESEERFRSLAESSDILITLSDETGHATYFNNAWQKLTGRSVDDLNVFGWTQLLHLEDRQAFVDLYLDAFKKHESWTAEFRLLNSAGTYSWILGKGSPRFLCDGSFAGYISSGLDITERKKVENENKKLVAIVESSKEFIGLADAAGNGLYINPAGLSLLGWKKVDGKKITDCIYPPDMELAEQCLRKLQEKGHFAQEIRFVNALTDEPFWLLWNAVAIRDPETGAVTGLATVSANISSQKRVEASLEKNEAGLRSMILQAPFAISILRGKDYVVEIANKDVLELWGRTEAEVMGKPILEAMPELLPQGVKELLDEVYRTGKRFSATEMPFNLMRKGRLSKVYVNFSYEPVFDENGIVDGIMPVGIEVTELVLARIKVEESKELLSAMVESAPFPIGVYVGEDMYIEIANKTMLDTWGKGPDVIGKSYMEILPELNNQQVFEQLKEVYTTGIPFHARNTSLDIILDGRPKTFYFNYSFTPLADSEGKVYGIMNTAADVTDLTVAKQQVESSEQHLNLAIAASNLGTGKVDFKKHQLKYNGRYLDIFGVPGEQVFDTKDLACKIHPDDLPLSAAAMQEGVETGIVNFTIRVLLPDNAYHWLNARRRIYLDEYKQPEKLLGTLRDVTPEKNSQQQLEENEAKLNIILEACGMAPLEYRIQTDEFIYSEKNLQIFGLNTGVYYNRNQLLAMFHPEDAGLVKAFNDAAITTGMLNYEARIVWPDHTVHWIHTIGKVFYDDDGRALKILGAVRDVTREKTYSEEIKENNERLNVVIDASELGIFELFFDNDELICSDRCLEIYGHTAGSHYYHRQLMARIHPDDLALRNKAMELAVGSGILDYEARIIWPDGSQHWVHALGKLFYGKTGKPFKLLGTVRDITKEKSIQQEIMDKEEKLNLVIDAAELGTWEWYLQTNEVKWSPKVYEIFGVSNHGDFNQKELLEYIHPEDRYLRLKSIKEALKTGVMYYAVRVIWPDESIHWIEAKGKLVRNGDGEPYRLLGTIGDITKVRNYQLQLRERERRFRMLANAMPQLVWIANEAGVVSFYNRRIAEFAGAVQLPDGNWSWETMIHPEDLESTNLAWEMAVQQQAPYNIEHRVKMKTGGYRWFLSRALPQRDGNGNVTQWYGSATDIHEIKEQDQQKDFFINLASHELKTPVTSIKGYTQLLQYNYRSSEDQFLQNSLSVINKQITKLTNLISDLLDLSKIKSGSLPLNKEDFDLPELAREVIDEITLIHPGYSISLTADSPVAVHADKVRIGQVLINLLTNAIKYSPDAKAVKVACEIDGDAIAVSVEDHGIGISDHDQEKIFQRFYRVEGSNETTFPGFGIGLFISSEIVKRHNGRIGVKSERGNGSVFYFTLPLNK